jgi:hypothetical protein
MRIVNVPTAFAARLTTDEIVFCSSDVSENSSAMIFSPCVKWLVVGPVRQSSARREFLKG